MKTTASDQLAPSKPIPLPGRFFTPLLLAIALLFGFAPSNISAQEAERVILYVDANSGNDSADGRSPEAALKTLNAAQDLMNAIPEEVPVTLRLARNSVWREEYNWQEKEPITYPKHSFRRDGLRIEAFGEGDLPTISGYDVLENDRFTRPDAEKYPNIWSQRVIPPPSYWIGWPGPHTAHPSIRIDGQRALFYIWTPMGEDALARDQKSPMEGIETDEDALAFVNTHPGTFYPRRNDDGSVDYFINPGADPTKDGAVYEYKVRGGFFVPTDNVWEDLRYEGLSHRDGVTGRIIHMKNVEFLHGTTHNMLLHEGHFEDVLSMGILPQVPETENGQLQNFGGTYSLFHTHGVDSAGLVYDRCIGKNGRIAFFDHQINANRAAVIIRDSVTDNVEALLGHGPCTKTMFLVGHRHKGRNGIPFGELGGLTDGENFVEDSVLLFSSNGWANFSRAPFKHLHFHNSVLHTAPPSITGATQRARPIDFGVLGTKSDYQYKNATLILDAKGQELTPNDLHLAIISQPREEFEKVPASIRLENCVIAVVNAPNIKTSPDGDGEAVQMFRGDPVAEGLVDLTFDNCVFTYIEGIPESAGEAGKDYEFASQEEIFLGNPSEGDYRIRPDGPAGKRDAGYREGREPIFRQQADALAREMPFYKGPDSTVP